MRSSKVNLVQALADLRNSGLPPEKLLTKLTELAPGKDAEGEREAWGVAFLIGATGVAAALPAWLGNLIDRPLPLLALTVAALGIVFIIWFRRFVRNRADRRTAETSREHLEAVVRAKVANTPYPFLLNGNVSAAAARRFQNVVLITVHGVESDNAGLRALASEVRERLPGLQVYFAFYPDRNAFRKLSADNRLTVYWVLYHQLQAVVSHIGSVKRAFIIAHSFGTLATVHALQHVIDNLTLDGIILEGSVLSRFQPWSWLSKLYGSGGSVRILNIVRPFDAVVPFGPAVGGGTSGRDGFIPLGWAHHHPLETYKNGGHCDYVHDVNEIVEFVLNGKIPLVSREDWQLGLSKWKRLRLGLRSVREFLWQIVTVRVAAS